jgi:hypothetical protein
MTRRAAALAFAMLAAIVVAVRRTHVTAAELRRASEVAAGEQPASLLAGRRDGPR